MSQFEKEKEEIKQEFAEVMARAQEKERKRIEREEAIAQAQAEIDSHYQQPDFHALCLPVTKVTGQLINAEITKDQALAEFRERVAAAKEGLAPMRRFWHKPFCDDLDEWFRDCDALLGRVYASRSIEDRQAYGAQHDVLSRKVGQFHIKTLPGGEVCSDAIALVEYERSN